MTSVLLLDVPENRPIVAVAADSNTVTVERVGPYFKVCAPGEIVIDRRATNARHAVWYSSIAGLLSAKITQWDKDALRLESR
ncbi:hypothetical protein [Gordonia lacunae]|uniref:Uncharacterized protein n=1 Tax=Gordonia lacunae TaxID=417102 RepID=A0A243Q8K4_9ACTN|nr:hypothetical protein [Gordonia lacunae]OUC78079.1 hypothetical protein CA982_14020 [Gordonia lacunae]